MFTLLDFQAVKNGTNTAEERLQIDRDMYLRGRQGYPTGPDESLSERDRDCYMMGYSTSEWEDNRA